jgi:hypothetical protein
LLVHAHVTIAAPAAAIWAAITDIENAASFTRGIEKIEILERPVSGLVGLKWRETRILFGKPASADKWITHAVENESFETRAESDGFVFVTTTRIEPGGDGMRLISTHDSRPQTIGTRIMAIPMALFFKGVAKRAILQDLNDIKAAVENR